MSSGRSSFSVTLLFASFFGAAMIATAFAYFNYKFSEYKFINFKEWVLYQKSAIFVPNEPYYNVIFYNSKNHSLKSIIPPNSKYPVLAIDFAQNKFPSTKKLIPVTAPTNTLLSIIQRFNIYKVPSIFIIRRSKESLYKQDSKIQLLE